MNHTPGPWFVEQDADAVDDCVVIMDDFSTPIARVEHEMTMKARHASQGQRRLDRGRSEPA